jgi:hypothetical protein
MASEVMDMTPVRFWIGLVLVVLGTLGVLDATGVIEASELIDDWWPVAILGLGAVIALGDRRVSFGSGLLMLIGLGLLVERQDWAREELVWPLALVVVGVVVLFGWSRKTSGRREQLPETEAQVPLKTP